MNAAFRLAFLHRAVFSICLLTVQAGISSRGEGYDLGRVNGIQVFGGSEEARELLRQNGFVVADPTFRQIFEAYIKSPQIGEPSETNPMGQSLPSFITADSAWHTYHVLLEEGVKQMEELQAGRLLQFSRRLLGLATGENAAPELAQFASVGLALQDEGFRQSLSGEAGRIVNGLRTGATPVTVPIGFDLSPLQFRAQSFYSQSSELSGYFAARQWYASVVFRLKNPRETRLAIALATIVNSDPALLKLWRQLSDPYDVFLATAEDGTVPNYVKAATAVNGTNAARSSLTDIQLAEFQKRVEAELPVPRINDQLLSPEQYAHFGNLTRGFRLLPPRQLPGSVCFQNTVDPEIPGRMNPSGLDFMAASPILRSPAAIRAVQTQFGKRIGNLIMNADCGPMPDSLHGDALRLLSTLQDPLPAQAPAALRTQAWNDLELWTQLGAWAEQRHTWALHAKITVEYMGMVRPPNGMVAPYPKFFSGLAGLARRTAEAFEKAGMQESFDARKVGRELSNAFALSRQQAAVKSELEMEKQMEANAGKLEQLNRFVSRYYDQHHTRWETNGAQLSGYRYQQMEENLEAMARRCAVNGTTNEDELAALHSFYDGREDIIRMINDFAPVCDRLARLAEKSLRREALTDDDAKWIEHYGVTLAGFSFYYGNSYEVPRDDFPIVTRVFSNPLTGSMLYVGLARPQALYVIVPSGNTLQLYRGAVMTYREFVRSDDKPLDDQSWRELISKGQTPPAPPFTRSFYAETSVAELLKKLEVQSQGEVNYDDLRDLLFQIGSRATEEDLPGLIELLTRANGQERGDMVDGLAGIIAGLPWKSQQQKLVELLASGDNTLADATAGILVSRPSLWDPSALTSGFSHQSPRVRRLYCAVVGHPGEQTEAVRSMLLLALKDPVDGVRWQAAIAIEKAGWNDARSREALLKLLNDTNEFVAAAAAHSLAQLGATNTAPALFTTLKTVLQTSHKPVEELERQSLAILRGLRRDQFQPARVLDPDELEIRLSVNAGAMANMKRLSAMRLPPRPIFMPTHPYDLATALIDALGDLGYTPAISELFKLRNTDYDPDATRALARIAPNRLADELITTAEDRKLDAYFREKALVTLSTIEATNRVRDLIPLLDDTTPIEYSRTLPGAQLRVCDRTAETIAILLGWQSPMMPQFARPREREETMRRVREWAKQAQ